MMSFYSGLLGITRDYSGLLGITQDMRRFGYFWLPLVTVRYRGQTQQKRTANTFSLGLVRFTSDDLGLPRVIGTARRHGCPPCPSRAAVPKTWWVRLVVTGQSGGCDRRGG